MHVTHIKRTAFKLKNSLPRYLDQYKKGKSIQDIAKRANYSPYLLARYMVQEMTTLDKKEITNAMKDPMNLLGTSDVIQSKYRNDALDKAIWSTKHQQQQQSKTTRLAQEVRDIIDSDPMYGPMHDKGRHLIGIEYEVVLEHKLQTIGRFTIISYNNVCHFVAIYSNITVWMILCTCVRVPINFRSSI
jgi:hypothetical protein